MLLYLENSTKNYGGAPLFENLSFQILSKQKITIVEENEYGKSTLLKILLGEERIEKGQLIQKKNLRIDYLSQIPETATAEKSVYRVIEEGRKDLKQV